MKPAALGERRALLERALPLCIAILLALTLARLIALGYSAVDFYADESQYWVWSRELAYGYYSKPPLLAWVIALAERVCGAGEACLRSPAPVFYFGTALLTYAAARALYDERVAFWSALTIALAPGVSFSSRVISTDVPLLFFWALALLAFLRVRERPDLRWSVVLGLALGLGTLAKYAMIYFAPAILLAALFDRETRTLLRRPATWLAVGIAAVLVAPNVAWNIANDLATVRATGENIGGTGLKLSAVKGLEFFGSQFGVFGPIAFAVLLLAFTRVRSALLPPDRLLAAFAAPPLAIVLVTAVMTGANPNWAAPAYIAGAILVAAVLVRREARGLLLANAAIGVVVGIALAVADLNPYRVSIPGLARPDVYERTLGWRALGEEGGRLAREHGTPTLVAENRGHVSALAYYLRDRPLRAVIWPRAGRPTDHFALTRPLGTNDKGPVLLLTPCPHASRPAEHYAEVVPLGRIVTPTGPTSAREYSAFRLSGPRGDVGPLAACR